jgi:hypothetical protein
MSPRSASRTSGTGLTRVGEGSDVLYKRNVSFSLPTPDEAPIETVRSVTPSLAERKGHGE